MEYFFITLSLELNGMASIRNDALIFNLGLSVSAYGPLLRRGISWACAGRIHRPQIEPHLQKPFQIAAKALQQLITCSTNHCFGQQCLFNPLRRASPKRPGKCLQVPLRFFSAHFLSFSTGSDQFHGREIGAIAGDVASQQSHFLGRRVRADVEIGQWCMLLAASATIGQKALCRQKSSLVWQGQTLKIHGR